MFIRRPTIPDSELRVLGVERAEATPMEHYARLVRLVHVTLAGGPARCIRRGRKGGK